MLYSDDLLSWASAPPGHSLLPLRSPPGVTFSSSAPSWWAVSPSFGLWPRSTAQQAQIGAASPDLVLRGKGNKNVQRFCWGGNGTLHAFLGAAPMQTSPSSTPHQPRLLTPPEALLQGPLHSCLYLTCWSKSLAITRLPELSPKKKIIMIDTGRLGTCNVDSVFQCSLLPARQLHLDSRLKAEALKHVPSKF